MFREVNTIVDYLSMFVFWYPCIMSLVWIAGALIFYIFKEKNRELDFTKYNWPKISILVPCYNEEDTIEETINYLSKLSYPDYEVIAVNDGSKDKTGKILMDLADEYSMLRVINCYDNKGKANALHMAAYASTSEYFICIDSDAILSDEAPYYLIQHFLEKGESVGAVTGNPRIRNRDTLLGKIQLVEYSSIIGLIKRAQIVLGKIMTVSGVIVAFRKKALMDVGLWDRDMITEDIAVSWKLQKNSWDIHYEPRALCWMLVPETIKGLWNQRVRWAQGSQEALIRHWDIFTNLRQRGLWIIYIEQVASIIWAFSWMFITLYLVLTAKSINELFIWAAFNSFALIMLNIVQLIFASWYDSKYDNIKKYYLWAPWYPTIYWMLNTFVVISAVPKAISSRIRGGYATWISPDRGNRI